MQKKLKAGRFATHGIIAWFVDTAQTKNYNENQTRKA